MHPGNCTHTAANLQTEHISQEMQSPKANIAYLHCFHTQQNSHSNYLVWLTSGAYTNSSATLPTLSPRGRLPDSSRGNSHQISSILRVDISEGRWWWWYLVVADYRSFLLCKCGRFHIKMSGYFIIYYVLFQKWSQQGQICQAVFWRNGEYFQFSHKNMDSVVCLYLGL